jgi:hypothetical protein
MLHLIIAIFLSSGRLAPSVCDFNTFDGLGRPNPGVCYDLTPFGLVSRRPTLAEAFPDSARSK